MTCNNIILAKPEAGASVPYTLPEGESARLSFGPEDISGLQMNGDGGLVIRFAQGGELTLTNFQDMVDGGNLLYLADGTLVDPAVLQASLASSVQPAAGAENATVVGIPGKGETKEYTLEPGKNYVLDFDINAPASTAKKNGDFIMTFANGGSVVLHNYETAMASADAPHITSTSKVCVYEGEELITNIQALAETPPAEKVAVEEEHVAHKKAAHHDDAQNVANVEPAAGDQAQQVANIEPAAGQAGATNSGYGFNSTVGSEPLGSIADVGPIDPTALQYGVEFRQAKDFLFDADSTPLLDSPSAIIDETDLATGDITVNGKINVDFGSDGPGVIVPNGNFVSSGSVDNNVLSSGGVPITVNTTANGYEGYAGGTLVFSFVIDPATGAYTFTQFGPLDHADPNNANDIINLQFGIDAIDDDGDRASTSVRIDVKDDAPVVHSSSGTVDETDMAPTTSVSGTVNYTPGVDVPPSAVHGTGDFTSGGSQLGGHLTSGGAAVTVAFDAAIGTYTGTTAGGETVFTLAVSNTGEYTFTLFKPLDHADTSDPNDIITLDFGIAVTDYDGDSTENVIRINVKDDVPVIGNSAGDVDETNFDKGNLTYSDTVNHSFGVELGSIHGNNNFTSSDPTLTAHGVAVAVTYDAATNTYTGKAGGTTVFTLVIDPATGHYTYTQMTELDHPDASNANDVIDLTFGVVISNTDGDNAGGTITIRVADDGPDAVNDITSAEERQVITGDVVANDHLSQDAANTVTNVRFGGVDHAVPAGGSTTITTALGTLIMHSDGTYTYTAVNGNPDGTDTFTYTLRDYDGDTDTANLAIRVTPDGTPVAVDQTLAVDETNLTPGPMIFNGDLHVNFGQDGQGSGGVKANNVTSQSGSLEGGHLTHEGVPVVITLSGNTYTGKAGDTTIFTLQINNDGTYSFHLLETLDHADATDPNDLINLNFGVTVTDADGDTADGNILIQVYDDAPVAYDDGVYSVREDQTSTGNVTTNDELSEDGPNTVTKISFNGTTVNVPTDGTNVSITGTYGTLTINNTGAYTYTPNHNGPLGVDTFTYSLTDGEGDTDTAEVRFNVTPDAQPIFVDANNVVDETDMAPTTAVSGTVNVNYGTDGPGVLAGNNTFTSSGSQLGGHLTSNGAAVTVTYDAATHTYTGTAGGATVFTLLVQPNGEYTFTLDKPLDHADPNDPNDIIYLNFGVTATDSDGDTTNGHINIAVKDDVPTIGDSAGDVDETNFDKGNLSYNDTLVTKFGQDVATVVGNNTFTSSDATLTSHGTAVVVTYDAATHTYTGKAGGTTVFTLVVDANGHYTYTQMGDLDHPDSNDPNDVISLNFGVAVTSADGDTDTGTITIRVADDGPVANDEATSAEERQLITGDVTANDHLSQDNPNTVTNVRFGGVDHAVPAGGSTTITTALGTLIMHSDGTYQYTAVNGNPDGTDVFTYTLRDSDGDTDTANLSVRVTPDGTPVAISATDTVDETNLTGGPVVLNGDSHADFGQDGRGTTGGVAGNNTFTSGGSQLGGNLTHNGVAIAVTYNSATGTYTGKAGADNIFTMKINADGTYTFTLLNHIDHADGTNPDDIINLNFGVTITDADGDKANGTVTVQVHDDAPVARDDGAFAVRENDHVSGNVTSNDLVSQDSPNEVTKVSFNGTTVNVPASGNATIVGTYGTLVIDHTGAYTYTPKTNDPNGTDTFTYTLRDYDGDTDTAEIRFNVTPDFDPVVVNATNQVDETNIGTPSAVVTGTVSVNYNGDGPGTVAGTGTFSSNGSQTGGALSHNGVPVTVAYDAGTGLYTGTAGGTTIFTLQVNANGSYTFHQYENIDHADGSNPNDAINLVFGVKATDADGDVGTGTITVTVLDDAPVIGDGSATIDESDGIPGHVSGSVTHSFGQDGAGAIVGTGSFAASDSVDTGVLRSNGAAVTVTYNAATNTYTGTAGGATVFTLAINSATGDYTFTLNRVLDHADKTDPNDNIRLTFGTQIRDYDGDTEPGQIVINVRDDGPVITPSPIVTSASTSVDETNLVAGTVTRTGTISVNYGGDTPAGVSGTGGFSSNGSRAGGVLTHDGVAVTVTYNAATGTYTGMAGSVTVFTMAIAAGGGYTFQQFQNLDHADGSNPNDQINLVFGVQAKDTDGDVGTGTITVGVLDDAPNAVNDTAGPTSGTSPNVTGNVMSNDVVGADNPGTITSVVFGGTAHAVPASGNVSIVGTYGTLTINSSGAYTYTANNHANGNDVFTYTLRDRDGDTDTATLTAIARDGSPTAVNDVNGPTSGTSPVLSGNILSNDSAGPDGGLALVTAPGTYTLNYGTLVINANGTYTYTANNHANGTDNFTYTIRDADGDTASATLTVTARDGSPDAVNDVRNIGTTTSATGNILTNDSAGPDGGLALVTGAGTYNLAHGRLTLNADGSYSYIRTSNSGGTDTFSYTIRDADGDTDTALLQLTMTMRSTGGGGGDGGNGGRGGDGCPLVVDLNGDGLHLVQKADGVMFDINNDGVADRTAWVGADDAILVIDRNNDGAINNHSEMFGNDQQGGFAMLGSYDDNHDGKIDANDSLWSKLQLWQDVNQDGISTPDELFTLDHFGIMAINLSTQDVNEVINGSNVTVKGEFVREDGSTLDGYDAWFGYDDGASLVSTDGKADVYGHDGADRFLFEAIGQGATTVHDFHAAEGDKIDLSAVLQGQDDVTDAINNFVFARQEGNDTVISVDVSGSGNAANAVDVARLDGVADLNIDHLLHDGNIVV